MESSEISTTSDGDAVASTLAQAVAVGLEVKNAGGPSISQLAGLFGLCGGCVDELKDRATQAQADALLAFGEMLRREAGKAVEDREAELRFYFSRPRLNELKIAPELYAEELQKVLPFVRVEWAYSPRPDLGGQYQHGIESFLVSGPSMPEFWNTGWFNTVRNSAMHTALIRTAENGD